MLGHDFSVPKACQAALPKLTHLSEEKEFFDLSAQRTDYLSPTVKTLRHNEGLLQHI